MFSFSPSCERANNGNPVGIHGVLVPNLMSITGPWPIKEYRLVHMTVGQPICMIHILINIVTHMYHYILSKIFLPKYT